MKHSNLSVVNEISYFSSDIKWFHISINFWNYTSYINIPNPKFFQHLQRYRPEPQAYYLQKIALNSLFHRNCLFHWKDICLIFHFIFYFRNINQKRIFNSQSFISILLMNQFHFHHVFSFSDNWTNCAAKSSSTKKSELFNQLLNHH